MSSNLRFRAKIAEQIQLGPHIVSTILDSQKKLQAAEIFGAFWDPQNPELIELFISSQNFQSFAEALAPSRTAAVNICNMLSFETYQLKGSIEKFEPINESQRIVFEGWRESYFSNLRAVGIPDMIVSNLNLEVDLVVYLRITDLFHQTPGPGTGQRL